MDFISQYHHPFTASIHCICNLFQAGDPSSGFHLLIWHTILSLWWCIALAFTSSPCIAYTDSALLHSSPRPLSRALTLSALPSEISYFTFFYCFSVTTDELPTLLTMQSGSWIKFNSSLTPVILIPPKLCSFYLPLAIQPCVLSRILVQKQHM